MLITKAKVKKARKDRNW